MDGKKFKGELTDKATSKTDSDQFIIEDGTFVSKECLQYGFDKSPYTASGNGSEINFEATAVSREKGKRLWKGKTHRESIEGTVTWIMDGQDQVEYSFTGTLSK